MSEIDAIDLWLAERLCLDPTLAALIPDSIHTVRVTLATGGTFTLTFGGQTTAAIAWNATLAAVQAALAALSSVGVGKVAVGGVVGAWVVQWQGTLATNVTALTGNDAGLVGAGATQTIQQWARSYDTHARQNAIYPYVTYQFLTGSDVRGNGPRRIAVNAPHLVQVVGPAASSAQVRAIEHQVDDLLQGHQGSNAKGYVWSIREAPIKEIQVADDGVSYLWLGGRYRLMASEG